MNLTDAHAILRLMTLPEWEAIDRALAAHVDRQKDMLLVTRPGDTEHIIHLQQRAKAPEHFLRGLWEEAGKLVEEAQNSTEF